MFQDTDQSIGDPVVLGASDEDDLSDDGEDQVDRDAVAEVVEGVAVKEKGASLQDVVYDTMNSNFQSSESEAVKTDDQHSAITLNQTASGPQFAPNLLSASGMMNPAAPSMAHLAWMSSKAWYLQN